jgi:UPF0755 protein
MREGLPVPDRPSGAGPRSSPIVRNSGEVSRTDPEESVAGDQADGASAEQPPAELRAGGTDDSGVADVTGVSYTAYDEDERYIEHETPSEPMLLGYTETGESVYAKEVGTTESGEPVFSGEMYTEHGDPVSAEEVIVAPVTDDTGELDTAAAQDGDQPDSDRPGAGGRGARRGGRRAGRRVEREHHPVLIGLAVLLVVFVIAALSLAWWAKDQIDPGGKPGAVVAVVIPPHSSSKAIGSILAKAGVIHSGTLFPYYVQVNSGGTLYPGTYQLPKNESYGKVLNALEAGPKVVEDRLTIPEGYTIQDMAQAVGKLPDVHITAAQFLAAAHSGQVTSPYEPAGSKDLEGLLFPATYMIKAGQTPNDILEQMVGAFDENAQQAGLTQGAAKLGMSPYQVVTVASMVEKEAKRDQDRGPIASVIYNRIHVGMPLGIDSTLLYALEQANPFLNPATVDPHTPNPYNTRDNPGLPPTPIANPGLPSLTAAANPPATTYLYYAVTGPGGQTSFASTSQQDQQIEAQCKAAGYCS